MSAQARFALTALGLVVLAGLLLYAGSAPRKDLERSEQVQAFNATVLDTPKPVVVDFTATWCGVCQEQAPELREAERLYGEVANFAQIDVDEAPDVAEKFGIGGVPTLLIFKQGRLVERMEGLHGAEEIGAKLTPHAN